MAPSRRQYPPYFTTPPPNTESIRPRTHTHTQKRVSNIPQRRLFMHYGPMLPINIFHLCQFISPHQNTTNQVREQAVRKQNLNMAKPAKFITIFAICLFVVLLLASQGKSPLISISLLCLIFVTKPHIINSLLTILIITYINFHHYTNFYNYSK